MIETENMTMNKRELRKTMSFLRNSEEGQVVSQGGSILLEELKKLEAFKKSRWIYLYASYGHEVSTWEVADYCFHLKKPAAFPKVLDKEHMEFYQVLGRSGLEQGFRGIWEPVNLCRPVREPGLMIMPGLAFDSHGNRLGYGGGFYDRYLCRYGSSNYYKIGAAYKNQMIDSVPADVYDIKMDLVLCV